MESFRHFSPRSMAAALVVLGLVLSACVSDESPAVDDARPSDGGSATELELEGPPPVNLSFEDAASVIIPNSPGTLTTSDTQRVMTALLGTESKRFLGGPDLPVTVHFDAVDGDEKGSAEGTWLTNSAAALGLYVSYFDFPTPGLWEVTVTSEGEEVGQALVQIAAESAVPSIGQPAPATESPTGATAGEIAAISTDQDPNRGFYDLSIADAIANGKPTVIAFVTPAFCQTALCGPTLEAVKAATAGRDDVDVVHVEPYDLTLAPQGILQPIPSMEDWGLQTEPWVFVVDGDGLVSASLEGIIGEHELTAALDRL